MRDITTLIVHHSDSTWGDAKAIDAWHAERGLPGIGYHAVILNGWREPTVFTPNAIGFCEAGVGLDHIGHHDQGQNVGSVGVCLVGKHVFAWGQIAALHRYYQGLVIRFGTLKIEGHGENEPDEGGTECPGNLLLPEMNLLRECFAYPSLDASYPEVRTLASVLGYRTGYINV
jgi:hypothetical protein